MATLPTGATTWGSETAPVAKATGELGPEKSQYGDMILREFYDRNIYLQAVSDMYANVIPMNAGSVLSQWFAYDELPDAKTPLTEGVTPAATPLSRRRVQKLIQQRGQWVALTDQERGRSIHDLPSVVVERLTQSFLSTSNGLAEDAYFLTGAVSGGNYPTDVQGGNVKTATDVGNTIENVFYGGTASTFTGLTTDSNGGDFTLKHIREMAETLRDGNVPMVMPRIMASTGVGTLPSDPAYLGFADAKAKDILFGLTEGTGTDKYWAFQHAHTYGNQMAIMEGEIGRSGLVRWIYTTETPKELTGVTKGKGRRLAITGAEALAMSALSGENFQLITAQGAVTGDELDQQSSIGWKATHDYSLVNPLHSAQLFYTTAT